MLALPAQAATIATAPPNNGSGGVFLNLTSNADALSITSFETVFNSTAGTAVSVEVWTRPGTYAGFTTSNAGWTLADTISGTSAGTSTNAPLVLATALTIGAGESLGIYLHSITVGGGIRYTGVAVPPQTLWSNADITLFSDVARTGNVPFAGTQFTPRTFSGVVNYARNSISTAPSNNGSGGVFLNLTSNADVLSITSFETVFSSAAGSAVSVEVWTRSGTYTGFTTSNAGWTLAETISGTSAGTLINALLVLTTPLTIDAGDTLGIYLHSITVGGGIRYTGTGAGGHQTLWSNADITLFSDVSRTGNIPFRGTQFSPRTFSGAVNYEIPALCPADVSGDGSVNVTDLLSIISTWGPCAGCPSDVNDDNVVNVSDLLAVISAWGSC